jgi:hypothetical protein
MPAKKLELGDMIQGHTYVGGDPNDQKNWLAVDQLTQTGLSGDEFLNKLNEVNPSIARSVKAMAEGREATPAGRVMTDPYWGQVFKLAQQYDPKLDQANYTKRQGTAKDFAYGQSAQNVRNLNQAIGHLKGLVDSYPSVAGTQGLLGLGRLYNATANQFNDWNGDPGITDYNAHRTALASELASVFKGKGSSAEREVEKFYDMLNPNLSLSQKNTNARAITNMLNSRLDELGQQYTQGMDTIKNGIDFLNPVAKKDFETMRVLGMSPEEVKALDVDNPSANTSMRGGGKRKKVGRFEIEEQ